MDMFFDGESEYESRAQQEYELMMEMGIDPEPEYVECDGCFGCMYCLGLSERDF